MWVVLAAKSRSQFKVRVNVRGLGGNASCPKADWAAQRLSALLRVEAKPVGDDLVEIMIPLVDSKPSRSEDSVLEALGSLIDMELRHLGSRAAPAFWRGVWTDRPAGWTEQVSRPETKAELVQLRRSVERGTPFGSESWVRGIVRRLGL